MTEPTPNPISRALISVSDKTGLAEFGTFLAGHGVEILSTGGSAQALRAAGVPVKEVSAHTGSPEIMDGRVKTLHPKVHGGILARRDDTGHLAAMKTHGIAPIDLVAVNLYPFEATVARGARFDACVENIDIGGPSLIRAAAKNHDFVTVAVNPADYPLIMAEMEANGGCTTLALRRRLAANAFARTAAYDAAIANWFAQGLGEVFPHRLVVAGTRQQVLRYGENPHQSAAFYATAEPRFGIATAVQLQGKELSYNNLNDTDAAFELVAEFEQPACAIIKHANPCGVAVGATLTDAYRKALACDPVSAFGGIVAFNRPLDAGTAAEVAKLFTEVVIAPEVEAAAREAFAPKPNLRLLQAGGLPAPAQTGLLIRSVAGGLLVQTRDTGRTQAGDVKTVTKRAPSAQELADLLFAFTVAKHVKSNAIVFARERATVGVGAGQMSRVDSVRIAAIKAAEAGQAAGESKPRTQGAVAASDAFFPFADGLIAVAEAGATAVIQPGGSMRDDEVIEAADARGLAMVFTGVRHFRH
ncbi:MAG: bifunctional phosphoribosylaminoimidazolecarboxamide formyltransferase/IMP cyclohydrolase [Alphaproteobacteria bacterium]